MDEEQGGPRRPSKEGREEIAADLAARRRTARRERIAEIYRACWNPISKEGEGLPLTPDDHLLGMRKWLEVEQSPYSEPVVVFIAAGGERELAAEYAALLAEEVAEGGDKS